MSVVNLEKLFAPRSVAVIGATDRKNALGQILVRNLKTAQFQGPIYPVNPKYTEVDGLPCWPSVAALPDAPDLAVVCTPPSTLAACMIDLGERGTRACIVLTATSHDADDKSTYAEDMLREARRYGLRILGPNCLGLLVPGIALNASFAHTAAIPGQLAFVSQSGALCTSILDWAKSRGIGFSHFVSMGDALDVDFGDLIDYLGNLPNTRALLLYMESVMNPRKFISAARAVARHKPVILIKAGRNAEGAKAAASHTGAITGSDAVFDAAIRRAGLLRVDSIDELFEAVETLAYTKRRVAGPRLMILTNGGGIGVLAADALIAGGGKLAPLAPEIRDELDRFLPANWSRANPVDIIGDADAERYAKTIEVLSRGSEYDAILAMLVPTATVDNVAVARAVAQAAQSLGKPMFAVWMGADAVAAGRRILAGAKIPDFETPTSAIRAFMQLVAYDRNQRALMQTPDELPTDITTDVERARIIIETALVAGRTTLTEPEAKALLDAYGIPVVPTRIAHDHAEAVSEAQEMGYPVAVKVLSEEISHKSDLGGVALDIHDEQELMIALRRIDKNIQTYRPDARTEGYTVQKMARRPHAYELLLGVMTDPIFGPAIVFGQGGTAVEVLHDTAVALPPLNTVLVDDLVHRTRVSHLLQGYRGRAPIDFPALTQSLIQLSQLVVDHAEILELDINPLLADADGVLALDARVRLGPAVPRRLAIKPYPNGLEQFVDLADGEHVLLRPIRPEDEPAHRRFVERCTPEDLRMRFFRATNKFTHDALAVFTQIDYDREMAFIACIPDEREARATLGVARAIADANNEKAEFAILIRSDMKQRGLGRILLSKLIDYQRARGTKELTGQVLAQNRPMLDLCRSLGFVAEGRHAEVVEVVLKLNP
ncbi:MAG: GNAT family N-acetyltransferase [Gammaproteobacteria bacterium]|nr:GNAT family N-acetyltransferase [Gammaproteobacteria bacterium]